MHRPTNEPAMSQKIFSLNLDVETVSLYLLCCALADAGAAITVPLLLEKWNGDRSGLEHELQRLEGKNILGRCAKNTPGESEYRLNNEKYWR